MDPDAAADMTRAVDDELQQVYEGPPLPKAFWKKLVPEKQVI
jgi:hypothetical protein